VTAVSLVAVVSTIERSCDRLLREADSVDLKVELDKHKLRKADVIKNKELQDKKLVFSVTGVPLVGPELAIPYLPQSESNVVHDPYEFIYAAVRFTALRALLLLAQFVVWRGHFRMVTLP
jgi:hypothetical protein